MSVAERLGLLLDAQAIFTDDQLDQQVAVKAWPVLVSLVRAAEKIAEGHMSSGVLPTECDWCWVDRGHDPDCPVALVVPILAELDQALR